MAHIVPSDISTAALAGAHGPELDTLAGLKTALPADYTVFHGVHWTRDYQNRMHFGEADFVVLNRSGAVLVIEQKNGALEETDQGLVKRYPNGPKNVVSQVRRSVENIREKMRRVIGAPPPAIDYLIYCPDHRLVRLNAVGLEASRVVDNAGAKVLAARIENVLGPGAFSPITETVRNFFLDVFEVVPDIHAHVTAHERTFTRLSGGLIDIVGSIEMSPLRLRVRGTPGSGKSIVASRLFSSSIASGRRPLLVCFNRPLAEKLSASLPPGGLVTTWHGLCTRFLAERGRKLDYHRVQTDPGFWREITDLVITEPVPPAWLFDTLLIDEGQDFQAEWYDVLRLFTKQDADVVWLEDPDQDLRGSAPVPLPGFVGLRIRANHRTPQRIASFLRRTLPMDFICANDLPGLGVGVTAYDQSEDQPALVAKVIARLLNQGFALADIVVLTLHGVHNSALSKHEKIENFTLSHFTGSYDQNGAQVMTPGQVRFESIYRFKGQQSPAVVVIDIDPSDDIAHRPRHLRLLFTACTRAMVRLELIAQRNNPLTQTFLAEVL